MDPLFPIRPFTGYRNSALFRTLGKMMQYITQYHDQRGSSRLHSPIFSVLIINTDENRENDLVKLASDSTRGRKTAILGNKIRI